MDGHFASRQPGTLAQLEMNREKKTRALLADLGVKPESAAVSLKAAVEALLKIMPQKKADALTQPELFEKAGIITRTTGQRALAGLLIVGQIQRIGDGCKGSPYRYFRAPDTKALAEANEQGTRKKRGSLDKARLLTP